MNKEGGSHLSSVTIKSVADNEKHTRILPCSLLLTSDTPDVDSDIFTTINECGLVYDGKLVVDNNFCTSDPNIYGAGTLTKFSRRYRSTLDHHNFDSREIGVVLGSYLLNRLDPLIPNETDAANQSVSLLGGKVILPSKHSVPTFKLPKSVFAEVLSTHTNMYIYV
jgi:hypothetical protein